jgi:hypothetical protein
MAVDIFLIAVEETQPGEVQDQQVWFGSAPYLHRFHELVTLHEKIIDQHIIDTLLAWPRDPAQRLLEKFDPDDARTFLENNRGRQLRIFMQIPSGLRVNAIDLKQPLFRKGLRSDS